MKLTESALKQLQTISSAHNNQLVRFSLKSGGCAGYEYKFELTDQAESYDEIIDKVLVVDSISYEMLHNATIDYESSLVGSQFKLDVPEAKSRCGCGTSFSL